MRPQTFLHIGMNKPGSTTIQSAFQGYDDGALEHLSNETSFLTSAMFALGFREVPPSRFVPGALGVPRSREDARKLLRDILNHSSKTAFLSSEEMSLFSSPDEIKDLIGMIGTTSRAIHLISYLRPPPGLFAKRAAAEGSTRGTTHQPQFSLARLQGTPLGLERNH